MHRMTRLAAGLVFAALLGLSSPANAQVTYWSNFQTNNGVNWLTAENGGGSSNVVVADRTIAQSWETFQVVDLDGGSLLDGDHIILKTVNNTIVGASCSGPDTIVYTNRAGCFWANNYYHFFIYKAGGSGGSSIASGDQVVLTYWSGYSIIADWGGGSTVQLNGTWGPDETFTIYY